MFSRQIQAELPATFWPCSQRRAPRPLSSAKSAMTCSAVCSKLAFVEKLPNGDRDFSFYRKPGADIMLTKDEVEAHADLIEGAKIFHLGTLSMTDEEVEKATKAAMKIAKKAGCIISFDPNLRPPLWSSEEKAKEKIAWGLEQCDVLKISDNEITFMTGEEDLDKGIKMIIDKYNIPLVFATYGPDGSKAYFKGIEAYEPGFLNPNTIETTGAGDTFCASALLHVLKYGLDGFDEAKLHELLTFANAAASLVTTKKGALCVMPTVDEVKAYIKVIKIIRPWPDYFYFENCASYIGDLSCILFI